MPQFSFRWLLITLACVGLSVDLVSKYVVFRTLHVGLQSGSREIIPGVFRLHVDFQQGMASDDSWWLVRLNGPVLPRVNHGALFGLGNQHTRAANGFFLVVSFLAAVAIFWWGARPATRRDPLLCAALGLILGGTLGNLFDRVVFGGVRDFLYFYLIDWPVFNIADSCLVVGAGALLFHALFVHPGKQAELAPAVEVKAATAP
jgi:signal peptidase II